MYICALCKFETEQDDIAIIGTNGRCICLRCYEREVGDTRHPDKHLTKEIQSALEQASG